MNVTQTGTGQRISGRLDNGTVAIYVLDCASCGLVFGINTDFEQRRRDDNKGFQCPNGHINSWHETEASRLRNQLQAKQRQLDYERDAVARTREDLSLERKQHAATKGKVTKLRRRAQAGMCSECGRTFQNYARHMETKHSA